MDELKNMSFVSVTTVFLNGHEQKYPVKLTENDIPADVIKRVVFGFRQGIDDGYESGTASYIGLSYRQVPLISGGLQHIYSEQFVMPIAFEKEFLGMVERWKNKGYGAFFIDTYNDEMKKKADSGELSELLTDDFYKKLNEKGGL